MVKLPDAFDERQNDAALIGIYDELIAGMDGGDDEAYLRARALIGHMIENEDGSPHLTGIMANVLMMRASVELSMKNVEFACRLREIEKELEAVNLLMVLFLPDDSRVADAIRNCRKAVAELAYEIDETKAKC